MQAPLLDTLLDAAAAVGIGLVVGLEREHRDIERQGQPGAAGASTTATAASPISLAPPAAAAAAPGSPAQARPVAGRPETLLGARTFALVSLFGWLCALLGQSWPWLVPAGALGLVALVAASYVMTAEEDRGLTTEVAALVVFGLGLLAGRDRGLAVTLGLVVTVLLVSKPLVTTVVPKLRRVDLTATLQLLIVLAVVLPLLPTEARDPWRVLSPRRIGLFVTLIAAVDYAGYVLHRIFGSRRGAGLTGLVGGLASSTAVAVSMARASRAAEAMVVPGQLATLTASALMPVRVVVLLAVVGWPALKATAPPLLALAACLGAGAVWKWRQSERAAPHAAAGGSEIVIQNPASLLSALKWGAFLVVVLIASAVGQKLLGDRGVIAAGALAGLADVDAITLALGRRAADGQLATGVAAAAIALATVTNTGVKAGIALATGGLRFGRDIAIVSAVGAAAAIATALLALR